MLGKQVVNWCFSSAVRHGDRHGSNKCPDKRNVLSIKGSNRHAARLR